MLKYLENLENFEKKKSAFQEKKGLFFKFFGKIPKKPLKFLKKKIRFLKKIGSLFKFCGKNTMLNLKNDEEMGKIAKIVKNKGKKNTKFIVRLTREGKKIFDFR